MQGNGPGMRPLPADCPANAERTWWINWLASKLQLPAQDSFAALGSLGRIARRRSTLILIRQIQSP